MTVGDTVPSPITVAPQCIFMLKTTQIMLINNKKNILKFCNISLSHPKKIQVFICYILKKILNVLSVIQSFYHELLLKSLRITSLVQH